MGNLSKQGTVNDVSRNRKNGVVTVEKAPVLLFCRRWSGGRLEGKRAM